MRARPLVPALLLLGALLARPTRADDPPVSLADFAAYRAALAPQGDPSTAAPVTFRDLWDHAEAHQGHPVRVQGRLSRLFRQPRVGQFPPLAEAWITSPAGEPTCLVFPTDSGSAVPNPGDQVEFVGTFLRRITYQAGDARRVAPLLVGPESPGVLDAGSTPVGDRFGPIWGGDHAADWGIGLASGVAVLWFLLRRHLARPLVGETPPIGPPPTFLDGGDDHDDP